ncbi:hypothetical protein KEM56_001207 [Ascosphaera pollenicola]|nr:hypothetical protein KEM56_001207 [Ascosphaera pollenicola]
MPPPVHILAHVRAPRGAEADARYRAQAQACLDFEPASSFEFEDTTDIFRSYVLEEDEEVVKGKSSKNDAEDGKPVRSALQSGDAQEDIQDHSYDESGTSFQDESARLGDWIPLEQSSSSARTSKLSQVTHQTLVEQTPVAMSKSLEAIAEANECRGGDEDVDDGEGSVASFLTPPSIVPDSQALNDAAEMPSPLANPELNARRSRWRRPGRLALHFVDVPQFMYEEEEEGIESV